MDRIRWHKPDMRLLGKRATAVLTSRAGIILTCLYSFHLITTYIWLKLDSLALLSDAAAHYLTSQKISDLFGFRSFLDVMNPLWLRHLSETVNVGPPWWPPFSQAVVTPFYTIFGRAPDTAVLIQYAIFFLILIVSVYGIGKKLFSRNVGLLASFIVTMYPVVLNPYFDARLGGRVFNIDLPLASMVALSLWALLLTNSFRNRIWSILFGITLTLGWLTKIHFPLFIIGPALLVIFLSVPIKRWGFIHNIKEHKKQILNMLLGLIAFLPAIWYWGQRIDSINKYIIVSDAPRYQYFPITFIEGMSFFLFIVSMIAFLYLTYLVIKKSLSWRNIIFLLLWIIIPVILLSIAWIRYTRFIAPLLPAMALASAWALMNIKFAKLKSCLVSLVIVFTLVQFFSFSFGIPPLPAGEVDMKPYPQDFLFPDWGRPKQEWRKAPTSENLEEVMELIVYGESSDKELEEFSIESRSVLEEMGWGDSVEIVVISNSPYLKRPMEYYTYLYAPYARVNGHGIEVANANYVLIYESGVWSYSNYDMEFGLRGQAYLEEHIDEFRLVGAVEVPDGDKLLVYENKESASRRALGLGRSVSPDTDMVTITSIHPNAESYQEGDKITVEIGLENIDDVSHNGYVWWELKRPEYKDFSEGSAVVNSGEATEFTLAAGEAIEVSLDAIVPLTPGSYQLVIGLRVYADEEHTTSVHSDMATYKNMIVFTGSSLGLGLTGSSFGLGHSASPDTDMVAITSIHLDAESYQEGDKITVEIGLKNIDTVSHEGRAFWILARPEYKQGDPASQVTHSDAYYQFTLAAGEETKFSLDATIPPIPSSYELWVGVRVYTDEEHGESTHSDVAYYKNRIVIE